MPLQLHDLQLHLTSTFFASLDTLFQKCGAHLHTLIIHDNDDSFLFSLSHVLFASIAQYASGLRRVVLAGTEETVYVEDRNVEMLTKACKGVQEFVDGQVFGVTPEALNYMAQNWSCLHSLSLNTELQPPQTFCQTISQFGPRLRSLSITHFRDCLTDPDNLDAFVDGLSRLTKLENLTLDLTMTRHRDGLKTADWVRVFDRCARIRSVEYLVGVEAYFDDEEGGEGVSEVVHSHLHHDPHHLHTHNYHHHTNHHHHHHPTGEIRTPTAEAPGSISVHAESGEWVDFSAGEDGTYPVAAALEAVERVQGKDGGGVVGRRKQCLEFLEVLNDFRALCEAKGVRAIIKWSL
ncbi:hypothetical protein HDV00_005080 [Rhizophlyctis rosea]|nr:hypothetical protein HDV00_005080 [Rhizophlyctis rosea]